MHTMEGKLQRWTGYLKGYQWRVFVLKDGCLEYYRSTDDASSSTNRRGSMQVLNCRVDKLARWDFVITFSGAQPMYLRAVDEVDRQRWITAIGLAAREARQETDDFVLMGKSPSCDKDTNELIDDEAEDGALLNLQHSLNFQLNEVQTCHTELGKLVHSLQRELSSLETSQVAIAKQLKPLFEKMMLVKMSADTLVKRSNDFVGLSAGQSNSWLSAVQRERQRRRRLEEAVETIARQHNVLESAVHKSANDSLAAGVGSGDDDTDGAQSSYSLHATLDESVRGSATSNVSDDDDDDDSDIFMDCLDDTSALDAVEIPLDAAAAAAAAVGGAGGAASKGSAVEEEDGASDQWPLMKSDITTTIHDYRDTIPDRPDIPINLWSIVKNFIGQDLSRIAMPVMINEPITFLQRLCEVNMEYSALLDRAATTASSAEQMAIMCAFAVTSYSSTSYRNKKPFNPLLGETFELDRSADLGWRCLCEQVSHHPPESAMHVESEEWQFWEDYTMTSKFRGKYAQVLPHGAAHVLFRRSGHHYTWNKPHTTIHNIIVGKLWIDSSGDMVVANHTTQDKCTITFHEFSYFSKAQPRRVTGTVYDKTKLPHYCITGTWDGSISYSQVLESKVERKGHVPSRLAAPVEIWRVNKIPAFFTEKYHFNFFTCCLNEEDESVAPTDSRRRPDQRVMESGDFDKANVYKVLLEEKQRQRRREREARIAELVQEGKDTSVAQHQPRYFRVGKDDMTGLLTHRYVGGYWEAKKQGTWGETVDLFTIQNQN